MIKLLTKCKDGGPESPVDAYFLIEWKGVFSVALLKFNKGRREAYHTHAFHALTWFLFGELEEQQFGRSSKKYKRGFLPKVTKRDNLHRVKAYKNSWCITLRGPWRDTWTEYCETSNKLTTLTHGRIVMESENEM